MTAFKACESGMTHFHPLRTSVSRFVVLICSGRTLGRLSVGSGGAFAIGLGLLSAHGSPLPEKRTHGPGAGQLHPHRRAPPLRLEAPGRRPPASRAHVRPWNAIDPDDARSPSACDKILP
jgi:hypothetical protein